MVHIFLKKYLLKNVYFESKLQISPYYVYGTSPVLSLSVWLCGLNCTNVRFYSFVIWYWASLVAQMVKNPPAVQES